VFWARPRQPKHTRRGRSRGFARYIPHITLPEGTLSIEVRCSCGQVYHADPAHAGRSLRCRCGRAVLIPASSPPPPQVEWTRTRRAPSPDRARLRAPAWLVRWLGPAAWGYFALATIAAALIWTLGDVWWPATVLLYGPRWLLLLPAFPLAVVALLIRPRLLIPLAAALLITFGPVMGFRTGWRRWFGGGPPLALRVISFNVEGGINPMLLQVPRSLERYGADVMVLQECPPRLAEPVLWPAGWTVKSIYGGLCLGTRFPVVETKVLARLEASRGGGTGDAALFRLRTDRGIIDVVALHLETPRKGLAPLRREGSADRLRVNTEIRDVGAGRISGWIQRETLNPVIVGDLNMPVESRIYRDTFGRCANAFSRAGRGFGWTRVLNRFSVRIDHVLACGSWRPLSAEVGPDLGSDHLPLIADLGIAR